VKELRWVGLRVGKSFEGSKLSGLSRQVGLDDRACGQGGECNPDALSVNQENGVLSGLGQRSG
jgi:hypothetical protein